jgi:N-acetylglucosaminyldiphosphoundecaprenol N-acetyl-beta-D-mannosaminyltransferase
VLRQLFDWLRGRREEVLQSDDLVSIREQAFGKSRADIAEAGYERCHGAIILAMAGAPQLHAVEVLGVRVHDVSYDEALEAIEGFVQAGGPHRVVTPNPEIVVAAQHDLGYRSILNGADLALPDGIGLILAAGLAGRRLRAHVRGSDLIERLAERSAAAAWRWFLLGGAPGVAAEAAARLAKRYPGLRIAGAIPGSPDPAEDLNMRRAIAEAAPVHVLLVAYGAPRQERWIARNQAALDVPIQMGVGGVFNFLAGRSHRAPIWVRRLELEWAYRLATEPWRWRRQLALPRFAALAVAEAIRLRMAAGKWSGRP